MSNPVDVFTGGANWITGAPTVQADPSLYDVWDATTTNMKAVSQTNSRSYYEQPFFDDLAKKLNAAGYQYRTKGGFAVAPKMVPFGGPVSSPYQFGGYQGEAGVDVINQMWDAVSAAHAKGLLKDVPERAAYEKQQAARIAADAQQSGDVLARAHGIAPALTSFAAGMWQGLQDPATYGLMAATEGVGALAGSLAPELTGTAGRVARFLAPQTTGAGTTGAMGVARDTLRGMAREGSVFATGQAALLPAIHANQDVAGIPHDTASDLQDMGWAFLQGAGFHAVGRVAGAVAHGFSGSGSAAAPVGIDRTIADLYPSWSKDMRDFAAARAVDAQTDGLRAEIADAAHGAVAGGAAPPGQDAVRHGAGAAIDAEISPYVPGPHGAETHGAALAGARSAFAGERPVPAPNPSAFGSSTNAGRIMAGLRARGLTEAQARGVAAGIMAESGGNPNIANKTSGAFGYGQWLGDRLQRLRDRFGAAPTPDQQLDFIVSELHGGDPGGAAVLAQPDEASVMRAYIEKFMRPKAGAETEGDLHRGMAALGRQGEGAPDLGEGGGATVDPIARANALAAQELALDQAQGMPPVRPDAIGEHVPGMPATDAPFDKPIWPQMLDPRSLTTDETFPEHGAPAKGGAVDVFERNDGTLVVTDGHGQVRDALGGDQGQMVLAHVLREADGWHEDTVREAARLRAAIEGRLGQDEQRAALGVSNKENAGGAADQSGKAGRGKATGAVAGDGQRAGGAASGDAHGGPAPAPPRGYDPHSVMAFEDPHGSAAAAQADMLTHDFVPREAEAKPGEAPRGEGAAPRLERAPEAKMPLLTHLSAADSFAVEGEGPERRQSIGAITRAMKADDDALAALRECL